MANGNSGVGLATPHARRRRMPASYCIMAALIAVYMVRLPAAFALDGTWIANANANWTGTNNWANGIVADGVGAVAWFTNNLTANRTITIDTNSRSLGILNIGHPYASNTFTIAASGGARLTFTNNGANAQLNQLSSSRGDTLSVPLVMAEAMDIANASTNPLTISGAITNSATVVKTLTSTGSGTGGVVLNGTIATNILVVQNCANGILTLGTANNTTNGVWIRSGTVKLGNATAAGPGNTLITLGDTAGTQNATLFATSATTYANPIAVVSNNTGVATLTVSAASTFSGAVTLFTHDLTVSAPAARLTLSAGLTGTGNLLIDTAGAGYVNFSGAAINLAGTITNSGSGTSATDISAGLGSNVTAIVQNSPSCPLTVTGQKLTVNAGGTTLVNNNTAGTASLAVAGGVQGTGNLLLLNNSPIGGGLALSNTVVGHQGAITNAGTGSGEVVISAAIASNVTGVVQASPTSRLVLGGANTYTGPTRVAAGCTLRVTNATGSATGTGAVTINGVLQGQGTLSGTVTNAIGGALAPGFDAATVGTLTVGTLVWNGGGIYRCKVVSLANGGAGAGTDYDQVVVNGALTPVPGGSNLVLRLDTLGQTLPVETTINYGLKVMSYGSASNINLADVTLDTNAFLATGTWALTNLNKALYVVNLGAATDRNYWTGTGTSTNWSTPTNWSKGHCPLPDEDVEFDFRSPGPCCVDGVTNGIRSLTLAAGYTGTVTVLTRFPGRGAFTNLAISGDCTLNGGSLTHQANTGVSNETDRLVLTVGGNLLVGPYGRIVADQKGFDAGKGPSAGTTPNSGTGGGHGGLASYGTALTAPGPTYGSIYAPTNLGSGAYGRAGGAILLEVAGTATINGSITTSGAGGTAGGAAGGSVLIRAGFLSGTGTVTATGGAGGTSGGAGGGGRIAVLLSGGTTFGTVSFLPLGAAGGTYGSSAGTVYLQTAGQSEGTGTLIIDNNNLTSFNPGGACALINDCNLNALSNIIIRNRGILGINTNTTFDFGQAHLQAAGVCAITNWRTAAATPAPAAIALRGTNLVTFPNPFVISSYSLCLDVPVSATGDWIVADNGSLSHSGNYNPAPGAEEYRLRLTLAGNLTVASGGAIEANTKGYAYWKGPAPAATGTGQSQKGASHGGRGGQGGANLPLDGYGSVRSPRTLGSGGSQYTGSSTPRHGSGSIELDIQGTTTVYGVISARNHQFSEYRCAGAGGGSIYLRTHYLAGTGSLDARGDVGNDNCAPGGGGRIAVALTAGETFGEVAFSAAGASSGGASPSGPGTLYLERASETGGKGTLILDNAGIGITSTNATQLPAPGYAAADDLARTKLVISNRAQVALTGNLTMKDLFLYTNSVLYLNGYTLQLNSVYHTNWGSSNWVVFSSGQIVWRRPGLLLQIH